MATLRKSARASQVAILHQPVAPSAQTTCCIILCMFPCLENGIRSNESWEKTISHLNKKDTASGTSSVENQWEVCFGFFYRTSEFAQMMESVMNLIQSYLKRICIYVVGEHRTSVLLFWAWPYELMAHVIKIDQKSLIERHKQANRRFLMFFLSLSLACDIVWQNI